jgi:uncharacterized protein YycO
MDAAQWQEAVDFATARIGQGYDWRNVFRFLTRIPGRENQRWFCSELVFKAIEVLQIPTGLDIEALRAQLERLADDRIVDLILISG